MCRNCSLGHETTTIFLNLDTAVDLTALFLIWFFSYYLHQVPEREFLLRAYYVELYNETLRDLLNNTDKELKIRETFEKINGENKVGICLMAYSYYLKGLSVIVIRSLVSLQFHVVRKGNMQSTCNHSTFTSPNWSPFVFFCHLCCHGIQCVDCKQTPLWVSLHNNQQVKKEKLLKPNLRY